MQKIDKKYIEKRHRVLDDTDLNDINNTFRLIEKTCESTNKRIDSLDTKFNFTLWFIGIGFVVLGFLIRMP